MATRTISKAGGNWDSLATWVEGAVPTAEDDVVATAESGNLTINIDPALCRSIDLTGYTKTVTHNTSCVVRVGSSTPGPGNVALKFVAGMTYSVAGNSSGWLFLSTSETVQTVDFAGKLTGNVQFSGTGGSWKLTGEYKGGTTAQTTLTTGTLDLNGQTCSFGLLVSTGALTRELKLGASAITITATGSAWNLVATGLTLSAGTSTITMSGTSATFAGGSLTYNNLTITASGSPSITGANTFANLTRTGTAVKTDALTFSGNQTITTKLTIKGNSAINRVRVLTNAAGTTRTITAAAAEFENLEIMDITIAGAAAPVSGSTLSDQQGNSGITFTTPTTQTRKGAGTQWSDVTKWTSRVPLAQDTVIVGSEASGTIAQDMPQMGKNVDFTGFAGTLNNGVTTRVFGSLIFSSGMTLLGSNGFQFLGRSASYTLTSGGKKFIAGVTFTAIEGTYKLLDDFVTEAVLSISAGTFDANGKNVTCLSFNGSNSRTILKMGSGTWTLTATTAIEVWQGQEATINAETSTILISTASTNARSFRGGPGTVYNVVQYTVAGSTGSLEIKDSCTIATLKFSDTTNARTLIIAASQTLTITSAFEVNGTSGKLMTIESSTAGVRHKLRKASGVVQIDYVAIKDSDADLPSGGARWLAGTHSENKGNNLGWEFNVVPEVKKGASAQSASGTWTAKGKRNRLGSASNSGSGAVEADGLRSRFGIAATSSSASFDANGNRIAAGEASLTANTSVSDVGIVRKFGRSQNSGQANWDANPHAIFAGQADNAGTGSADANALRWKFGKASPSASGSAVAKGRRTRLAAAPLSGSGSFAAVVMRLRTGSAEFEAIGSMDLKLRVEGGYGSISDRSVGTATVSDEPVGSATLSQEP